MYPLRLFLPRSNEHLNFVYRPVNSFIAGVLKRFRKEKAEQQPRNARYWVISFSRKLGLLLLIILLYFVAVDSNFLWLFGKSPELDALENPQVQQASELYTADGVLIGKYYTENRSPVSFGDLSPKLVDALVSTEDVRFYLHSGIDLQSLPSILLYQLRGDRRGGSTLTQQLAKNLYDTRGSSSKGLLGYIPLLNTIISKSKEWLTAIKLERRYTKDEIVTMYLNTVDFGANSFGVKTASRTFFSKTPDSLEVQEAAMLVGLLKAPTTYSPISHPEKAQLRRNIVLQQMLKNGKLAKSSYDSLAKDPVSLNIHIENHFDGPATYFRGVVNNYLKSWCKENGYDLYTDGLKIYTTINSHMQKDAEEALDEHMRSLQKRFNEHWKGQNPWADEHGNELKGFIDSAMRRTDLFRYLRKKYKHNESKIAEILSKPKKMKVFSWSGERDTTLSSIDSIRYYKRFLHAGFMAMDPYSGQIKAWVGGINFKYFQYDHVMQAKRQPGSTFKPILYAAAFENGYGPCDILQDVPVTVKYVEHGEHKTWSPHNADYNFSYQNLTLRHAMGRSINSIAAQLTEKIGWATVIDYAHRLGIKSDLDTVPSVGLGSSDVSVYELTGAYSAFMNRGVWTEPAFLTRIVDRNGKQIKQFNPVRKRAVSEETAWLMQYMLKGGLEEPGATSGALFSFNLFRGNELGGKTGTSSNHSDGWFVGVTKDLVAGMWVGGDDRSIHFRTSSTGEGAKTALPIFGKFMEKVYADKKLGITMGYFPKPTITISKPHDCRTKYIPDSLKSDTLKPKEEGL